MTRCIIELLLDKETAVTVEQLFEMANIAIISNAHFILSP